MKGVRKRTLALIEEIPPDRHNWRLEAGSMSPAHVIHHIAATEKALWGIALSNHGKPAKVDDYPDEVPDDESMPRALAYMALVRAENSSWWQALTDEELDAEITGPTGRAMVLRRWLMLAPEHEIHHRGILHAYRKLWGMETVPLYDQTLETLRANLDKLHGESPS